MQIREEGALDFKQYVAIMFAGHRGAIPPSVCWLKSKRPANSLPYILLSWPLELQRGQARKLVVMHRFIVAA